ACWSRDGKWLIAFQPGAPLADARFVSYPEGQVYPISMPKELAKDNNTICLGASADKETLYFYQAGYDLSYGVWVASAEGTALKDVDIGWFYGYGAFQWTADGREIIHQDARYSYTKDFTERPGDRVLFSSPLSGERSTPFTLPPNVSSGRGVWASPDSKWLLFTPVSESGGSALDLNVIPLSIADREANGPSNVLFRMTRSAQGNSRAVGGAWSPDSTRVAVAGKADSVKEHDIWVTFVDGRTPIRLTQTEAIERDLTWSRDGTMLAFISDDAGVRALKVIPSVGGEAVVVRHLAGAETPLWVWSPDGKSLTMAEGGMLVRQPFSGGKAEPIGNLETFGITELEWFDWSPDGSQLALANHTRNRGDNNGVLASWGQLVFARVEGGRLQKAGVTDLGPSLWAGMFAWSPDSAHVACGYEGIEPVGPGGRLYTVAVDDIVDRIEAGAIPPTGPKPAERDMAKSPAESKPTPQLEPITGPVFSDNFDNGLSEYWQVVPANATHAVENGQLMLSNCSVRLNQIDWADYLVTVRLCVKEGEASERGIASIQTRATPFEFDVNMLERYALLFICSNDAPACMLRLALYYHNASGAGRGPTLDRNRCPLVPGKWYKLAFEIRGEQLRAYLDDKLMIETTDARLSRGPLWISASESPILFDDFSVRRLP
ncbi:MAG: PD40 domain-containing protein, partial [Sedimentisphaerales bacterium]|nr:PD40 domain-containing protein [Sedimentisphaerales bacterium]